MDITPLPPLIDPKILDFKLTPGVKVGEILEGVVDQVLENKTYLFKLKGFTFKARSPLDLKKHDRIQVEVQSLAPKVILRLLPQTSTNKSKFKEASLNETSLPASYFATSNLSSLGMNNLAVKTFTSEEEVSPRGVKTNYQAMDILLEMSELGKVLVRITRHGSSTYYQVVVEDREVKEFVEENLQKLLGDLKNAGYVISHINCTVNPTLKSNKKFEVESTLSKTEKGYSRLDVIV